MGRAETYIIALTKLYCSCRDYLLIGCIVIPIIIVSLLSIMKDHEAQANAVAAFKNVEASQMPLLRQETRCMV